MSVSVEVSQQPSGGSETPLESSLLPSPNPTKSFWQESFPSDIAEHRTTQKLPAQADVVIIGSGISGAFAAHRLWTFRGMERQARRIVVLEARNVCSAATGRNGGHCQPLLYESPPETAKFELRNYYRIADMIFKNGFQCEYQQMAGGCHAFFWKEAFEEAKAKVLELRSSIPEVYRLVRLVEDREELAALKVPHAIGAIVQSNAASLSGYKLVTSILSSLLEKNAINLQTNTPVTAVRKSYGGWVIESPRGEIKATQILFTTNAYTGHLLPQFRKLIVPIQAQMSASVPPGPIEPSLYSYYFVGAVQNSEKQVSEDYLIQRPVDQGGEWMYGGGRVLAKNLGVDQEQDDYNDDRVVKYLKTSLGYVLDLGDKEHGKDSQLDYKAFWTGIYGQSVDGHPWVGAVPDMPGIFVCGGYSGHGMPNAALCAEHVASTMACTFDELKAYPSMGSAESRLKRARFQELVEMYQKRVDEIPSSYVITRARMEAATKLETDGFDKIKAAHALDAY